MSSVISDIKEAEDITINQIKDSFLYLTDYGFNLNIHKHKIIDGEGQIIFEVSINIDKIGDNKVGDQSKCIDEVIELLKKSINRLQMDDNTVYINIIDCNAMHYSVWNISLEESLIKLRLGLRKQLLYYGMKSGKLVITLVTK